MNGKKIELKEGKSVIVTELKDEDFEGLVKMYQDMPDKTLRWQRSRDSYDRENLGVLSEDENIVLIAKF